MKLIKETQPHFCKACDDEDVHDMRKCEHKNTCKHVLILPGCCDASRKALYPRVRADIPEAGLPLEKDGLSVGWYIPVDHRRYVEMMTFEPAWGREEDYTARGPFNHPHLQMPPDPTFCPFCGTALPEIIRDQNLPAPLTQTTTAYARAAVAVEVRVTVGRSLSFLT